MPEERTKLEKVELGLGWLAIIGSVGMIILLVTLSIFGQITHLTLYLRALIIIPFVLWYGIKTVRKYSNA